MHDHAKAARRQLRQETKTLAVLAAALLVAGGAWLALTRTTPAAEAPPQGLLRGIDVVLLIAIAGLLGYAARVLRTWIRYRHGVPADEAHDAGMQRLWAAMVRGTRRNGG